MKIPSMIFGPLIGAVLGFVLAALFFRAGYVMHNPGDKEGKIAGSDWPWPDSLDEVKAAPKNHRIIYEDDRVRLLEVILWPNEFENLHTHKLPSVMFGSNNGDTSSFDIIYYRYRYDPSEQQYVVRDSTIQHSRGTKASETDIGHLRKPEGPHAIKNLSNVKVDIYRLEFKK
jgi:hypothetical protein